MYVANIVFHFENLNDSNLEEYIDYLMHSLHNKGLSIHLRNLSYERNSSIIVQYRSPEKIPPSHILTNKWSKELIKDNVKIEVNYLGEDFESFPVCKCEKSEFYILAGSEKIPLSCGSCGRNVPLYKIPYTARDDMSYRNINSWNKENLAWSAIEYYSAEEPFAHEQLCNINSSHNIEALVIRSTVEKESKSKCFYFLEELRSVRSLKIAESKKCPSCDGDWHLPNKLLDKYDFMCENCRLLSTLAPLE